MPHVPHAADKEGIKAFKKNLIAEIEKLGGKAKETEGLGTVRATLWKLKGVDDGKPALPVETPVSVAPKVEEKLKKKDSKSKK